MSGFLGLFGGGKGSNALGANIDNPLKRFLQERSFLVFEFFDGNPLISLLPFFENITITEDQKANYAVYDLIGRAGNLYAYTGAKSRQFKLNFKLTVPHIHHILRKEGFDFVDLSLKNVNFDNKKEIRELFLNPPTVNQTVLKTTNSVFDWSEKAVSNYEALVEKDPNLIKSLGTESLLDQGNRSALNATARRRFRYNFNSNQRAVNFVLWCINLVRSSVINNSKNSIYGPPIIRLNHGLMYNNVPCICTNYSIKESNNSSYDVPNLFPNVIDVSMTLEEVRDSSTDYFVPGRAYEGDAVAGWNDLHKYKTMDPYNGIWGSSK